MCSHHLRDTSLRIHCVEQCSMFMNSTGREEKVNMPDQHLMMIDIEGIARLLSWCLVR